MINIDFSKAELKLKQNEGKTVVFDPIRKGWFILTPEEHVRQCLISHLISKYSYPSSLMAVEKQIIVGSLKKRFDIVIYNREHKPWMLIECKAPEVSISEHTLNQLLSYQQTAQCNYWLITNGHQTFCANACDIHHITWEEQLPAYH